MMTFWRAMHFLDDCASDLRSVLIDILLVGLIVLVWAAASQYVAMALQEWRRLS